MKPHPTTTSPMVSCAEVRKYARFETSLWSSFFILYTTKLIFHVMSTSATPWIPSRQVCVEMCAASPIFNRSRCLYDCRRFTPPNSHKRFVQSSSFEAYWGLKAGCAWLELMLRTVLTLKYCSTFILLTWHDNSSEQNATNISLQRWHAAWWM